MTNSVTILVGTITGTAELVADEISEVLEGAGLEVDITLMDGLDANAVAAGRAYIICSSTYGHGDVPDNGQAFMASLRDLRPDLSGVRYGLFALGDSTYAKTFCFGGLAFDKIFSDLGATRVGEAMKHDASSGTLPEDEAGKWAEEWRTLLADAG